MPISPAVLIVFVQQNSFVRPDIAASQMAVTGITLNQREEGAGHGETAMIKLVLKGRLGDKAREIRQGGNYAATSC